MAGEPPGRNLEQFAGVAPFTALKPVKKLTNRKVAVARIWKAIQTLLANVAQPAKAVASAKRKPKKDARKGKRRHTARAAAKDIAREGSKKAEVIDRMRRSPGRHACRDHGADGLAGPYRARLRQHPGQQVRGEGRIFNERRRGAQLPLREVTRHRINRCRSVALTQSATTSPLLSAGESTAPTRSVRRGTSATNTGSPSSARSRSSPRRAPPSFR